MAAETFELCVGFPVVRSSFRYAVSTPDGSPVVRARNVNETGLRTFTLRDENMPRQVLAALKLFWREICLGPSQPVNFTPPGETEIEVRMKQPSFVYQVVSATKASVTFDFEEVR